jgi:hypothetical protein
MSESIILDKNVAAAIGQFLMRVSVSGTEAEGFTVCVKALREAIANLEEGEPEPPGI